MSETLLERVSEGTAYLGGEQSCRASHSTAPSVVCGAKDSRIYVFILGVQTYQAGYLVFLPPSMQLKHDAPRQGLRPAKSSMPWRACCRRGPQSVVKKRQLADSSAATFAPWQGEGGELVYYCIQKGLALYN